MKKVLVLAAVLASSALLTPIAFAQTAQGVADAALGTSTPAPGMYPIQINIPQVNRAGITPGTGYVLLRDLKALINVTGTSPRYTMQTPGLSLSFRAGARSANLNGQPAQLNATPIQLSETLLFPLSSLQLLGCSYTATEIMKPVRQYVVSCQDSDQLLTLSSLTFKNGNDPATALKPTLQQVATLHSQMLRRQR